MYTEKYIRILFIRFVDVNNTLFTFSLLQSELYLNILYFRSNFIITYGKYYIFSGKLDIKEIDKFK